VLLGVLCLHLVNDFLLADIENVLGVLAEDVVTCCVLWDVLRVRVPSLHHGLDELLLLPRLPHTLDFLKRRSAHLNTLIVNRAVVINDWLESAPFLLTLSPNLLFSPNHLFKLLLTFLSELE
jgi:hypothetical protein